MTFIESGNVVLPNLSDRRTVIYTAEMDTYITRVNVSNISTDDGGIRISLKIVKSLNVTTPIESFLIPYMLFEKNISRDLVNILGEPILLKNGDSLIIFSAGYSQVFDCAADYFELNETLAVSTT